MKLLMTKVSINYNMCADCHDVESAQPSSNVADTGVCCACGSISNVWDIELLQLYRGVSISDEVILRELPRLRCSHIPGTPKTSYAQIGQSIAASRQETVEDIAEVDANPEIIGQPPARGCWFITREEYDVVKRMIRGSYMPVRRQLSCPVILIVAEHMPWYLLDYRMVNGVRYGLPDFKLRMPGKYS